MRAEKIVRSLGTFLLLALVLGALAGCGSGGEEDGAPNANEPREGPVTTPENPGAPEPPEEGEARENIVVRLSGTPGMVFAGSYGNLDRSEYAEDVIEDEPVEYEVDVRDNGFDTVSASFVNYGADGGTLVVEILMDGEVVAESDTSLQYGAVNVTFSFGG